MSEEHHSHHHHHYHHGDPRSHQAGDLSEDYDKLLSSEESLDSETERQTAEDTEKAINSLLDEEFGTAPDGSDPYDRENSDRRGKKNSKKRRRKKKRANPLLIILIVIVVLLLAVIGTFLYLRMKGEKDLQENIVEPVETEIPEEAEEDGDYVIYNGEKYCYNNNIITLLCIGIDREDFAGKDDGIIGGNGQADADFLVALDKESGKISIINISRDSMVDVDRYNTEGQYVDTVNEQLCLSFAYGDGQQTSCENTALSVSRLMYGISINGYAAIDFNSLGTLNDAVGGVTVPVTEDIADSLPGSVVGEQITLQGDQAVTYVRHRDTAVLDSNNGRMERQKQFISAFMHTLVSQLKSNPTEVVSLYQLLSDNVVTSLKLSEITYLGTFLAANGFSMDNISSVPGQVVQEEDGYAGFHVDEDQLYQLILNVFYTKQ